MTPVAGDILKVYCTNKMVWHFGVYAENGRVIDMAPKNGIKERTWEEFSEGEAVYIEPRKPDDLPRQSILARARLRIGEKGYSVLFSNCEHFVSWCRKGKENSKQVLNFLLLAIGLIAIIVLLCQASRKR